MAHGHHAIDPPDGSILPIWNLEALSLKYVIGDDDDTTPSPYLNNRVNACFKAHWRTTRLLLKHARNQRRLKYGKALLRMLKKNKQRMP